MAKDSHDRKNVNEPGEVNSDSPYYDNDAEREEAVKVPVEYLGYLAKRKVLRWGVMALWIVILIIVLGLGPGTRYKDYCPRTGESRTHLTFAWGHMEYVNPVPEPTDWTEWYLSKNPEYHNLNWMPYGTVNHSLFGFISLPGEKDLGWEMPENLVTRMMELDKLLRPGKVLDIPRVLGSVNNAGEWNAIIVPLTEGTAHDAFEWWNDHKATLKWWADMIQGSPLPDSYVEEAREYIEKMRAPEGNPIPII